MRVEAKSIWGGFQSGKAPSDISFSKFWDGIVCFISCPLYRFDGLTGLEVTELINLWNSSVNEKANCILHSAELFMLLIPVHRPLLTSINQMVGGLHKIEVRQKKNQDGIPNRAPFYMHCNIKKKQGSNSIVVSTILISFILLPVDILGKVNLFHSPCRHPCSWRMFLLHTLDFKYPKLLWFKYLP